MKQTLIIILLVQYTVISYSQKIATPKLVDFSPSECDHNVDVYRLRTRIIDKWIQGDTLLIEVGTRATCCVEFIPEIKYNNDTLCLLFQEMGEACECICCYQFIYHITGLKNKQVPIKLQNEYIVQSDEKYFTYQEKYEVLNGDTINYVDKYGLKQGYWKHSYDSSLSYMRAFAVDDRWKYMESVFYDDSSRISSFSIKQNFFNSTGTQFYENGLIKRQTTDNKDFYQEIKFYSDGILESIRISGDKQYFLWKEFYPNGVLKVEKFGSSQPNLSAKYYYDNGMLMCEVLIIRENPDDILNYRLDWKCYDKSGKLTDKKKLIEQGYLDK